MGIFDFIFKMNKKDDRYVNVRNAEEITQTPSQYINIETGEVILIDDAFIEQDGNTLSAGVITYNTITKKVIAYSAHGKRVKSVIYPNKLSQKKK
uniref:hypothetical protein n=1 Tax=Serratia marcescens TaxID=615 RepID=UPI001F4C4FFF|nr:hypothetical protein [Serratia marcescens]ULG13081.1 lipopolysaccharide transport periplasmic proteinLptA [Serratia marcescens]